MTKSIRSVERLGRLINTSLHEVGAEGFDAPAFRECTPQGYCTDSLRSVRAQLSAAAQHNPVVYVEKDVYAKTYDIGDGVYKATHQAVALFLDAL